MRVNKDVVLLTIEGAALLIEKHTLETPGKVIDYTEEPYAREPSTLVTEYTISEFTTKGSINVGVGDTLSHAFSELPTRLKNNITTILDDIHNGLLHKAEKFMKDNILKTDDYDEFVKYIESASGMVYAKWCGDNACENKVKEDCKATSRCIPINQDGLVEELKDGKCIVCGKPAKYDVYWSKAY